MADERFDGILLSLAQQLDGGIAQMLDIFFSFLYRKTDFFTGADEATARAMVTDRFNKFVNKAKKEKADKEREREEELKPGIKEIIDEEPSKPAAKPAAKPTPAAAATPAPTPAAAAAAAAPASTPAPAPFAAASASASDDKGDKGESAKKRERRLEAVSYTTPSCDDSDGEDGSGKGKLLPNELNGANANGYVWGQTLKDLEIRVPLVKPGQAPVRYKAKDCIVDISGTNIKVGLRGQEPIISGKLFKKVHPEESTWLLDNGTQITIHLDKVNQMEWWGSILEGEKEINCRKVQPENSKLSDLDGETRSMVEKMMIDNQRKQAGMPSLEEEKKMEMLEKFKQQHPEMDFSKVKMT